MMKYNLENYNKEQERNLFAFKNLKEKENTIKKLIEEEYVNNSISEVLDISEAYVISFLEKNYDEEQLDDELSETLIALSFRFLFFNLRAESEYDERMEFGIIKTILTNQDND